MEYLTSIIPSSHIHIPYSSTSHRITSSHHIASHHITSHHITSHHINRVGQWVAQALFGSMTPLTPMTEAFLLRVCAVRVLISLPSSSFHLTPPKSTATKRTKRLRDWIEAGNSMDVKMNDDVIDVCTQNNYTHACETHTHTFFCLLCRALGTSWG